MYIEIDFSLFYFESLFAEHATQITNAKFEKITLSIKLNLTINL